MNDVSSPTLLLNEEICKANILRMSEKAKKHNLKFKPHMKTHQSAKVGEWFVGAGTDAITVSSVTMARYFAEHGWKDITIAFPCNIAEIPEINKLARAVSLTLLVNKSTVANALENGLTQNVNAYIEIDTGAGRTGLKAKQTSEIEALISVINRSEKLQWAGFYSHPGHSYSARSKKEILQIHESVLNDIKQLRNYFEPLFDTFEICIGDTPCCSVANDFSGIDALSPGNFTFYDLMQNQIGSCDINDIAVAMACPIVDKYKQRNEIIIYGGAVHFSKESLQNMDFTHYGMPAQQSKGVWHILDEKTYVKALSQEHGIITCSSNMIEKFSIGDTVNILPVHSCLTANLMDKYMLNGKEIVQL